MELSQQLSNSCLRQWLWDFFEMLVKNENSYSKMTTDLERTY